MKLRHAQMLVALGAMWGISFILIKYAIEDLSALATSAWRSLVALSFLTAIWIVSPVLVQAWREIRRRPLHAAVLGCLQIVIPFTFVHMAESSIPAGVVGVLVATQTFFIGLFAPVFDVSERYSRMQAFGLLIGLVGVALVVGFEFIGSAGAIVGVVLVLITAISYALGAFMVKVQYHGIDGRVTAYVAVASGAILLAPTALFTLPDEVPGTRAVLSVLAIGILGTALALAIYCHLVGEVGAGKAALSAYLAPAFALLFAWIILGESLSALALFGLVLIIIGVVVAGRRKPPGKDQPVEDELAEEMAPAPDTVGRI